MHLNRIYVCYAFTTLLISLFIYTIIYSNVQNTKKLERLREEVDDIAHLMLQTPYNGKAEPKYLTDLIDNFVKKRLAGIWDDLYAIKKQIKGRDCAAASLAATSAANKQVNKNAGMMETVQGEERVNYASEELGAKVVNVKAEPICASNFLKSWLGMEFSMNPPINMLNKNMEPGKCFGFKNANAEVTIQLAGEISIEQIVLQHIIKNLSPIGDTASAPKDFQVFGLQNNDEFHLGSFRFEYNNPVQTYNIRSNEKFRNLRFQFNSNHGHPEYTCVYRLAVYGKL